MTEIASEIFILQHNGQLWTYGLPTEITFRSEGLGYGKLCFVIACKGT